MAGVRHPLTIAIDGPAASGKGTIARALARHYGLPHLDTGALYRAVALAALEAGVDLTQGPAVAALARALDLDRCDDARLRADRVARAASAVAALPEVRNALLDVQRRFAAAPPGAVLDGRDIGTVILPQARAKLFVTARPEVRARRRFLELAARGTPTSEAEVLADIRRRDLADSTRPTAPLARAPDAVLLDTSDLDIDEAVRRAIDIVEARIAA